MKKMCTIPYVCIHIFTVALRLVRLFGEVVNYARLQENVAFYSFL